MFTPGVMAAAHTGAPGSESRTREGMPVSGHGYTTVSASKAGVVCTLKFDAVFGPSFVARDVSAPSVLFTSGRASGIICGSSAPEPEESPRE